MIFFVRGRRVSAYSPPRAIQTQPVRYVNGPYDGLLAHLPFDGQRLLPCLDGEGNDRAVAIYDTGLDWQGNPAYVYVETVREDEF